MQDYSYISLIPFLASHQRKELTFVQCSFSDRNETVGRPRVGHLRIAGPQGIARGGMYSDLRSILRAGKLPIGEWQHMSVSCNQQLSLNKLQDHACQRLTSSGIYSPRTLAPPFGQTRGGPLATGGYMRNASSRQASIYVRRPTLTKSISSGLWNVERTSCTSFW